MGIKPVGAASRPPALQKNISDYNKIVILGNNGSGKSWLAKQLAAATGLPLIHLDAEFWRPNWEMPSKEGWLERNRAFIAGEQWIIEGMCSHGNTMELRFAAAELAIILDVNRFSCVAGVIKRQGKPRTDTAIWPDEIFDWNFVKFLRLILTRPGRLKREYMALHETYPDTDFWVVKGRRDMKKLIEKQ